MPEFVVGDQYTREEVAQLAGLPPQRSSGGAWMTGYADWDEATYIFTNVGVAGRTGHDYPNRWDDKYLIWFGKTRSHRGQPQIDRMISITRPVRVFWRGEGRSPFTYAGDGAAVEANDETSVRVVWTFENVTPGARISTGASNEIKWHRGPPPAHGSIRLERFDGPTDVYLRLAGRVDAILDVPAGHALIKVGMSNNIERRLTELNAGFPPGSKVSWQIVATRHFDDAKLAYQHEGHQERLRLDRYWRGGEFAVLPEVMLDDFFAPEA